MQLIRCIDHFEKPIELPIEKFTFRIAVSGILKQKNSFLVAKDAYSKLWEIPGGGVQIGETLKDALRREFLEETGIEVVVDNFINYQESYFYAEDRDQAWQIVRHYFCVTQIGGQINKQGNGKEICEVKFLLKKDLTLHNTKRAFYRILASL